MADCRYRDGRRRGFLFPVSNRTRADDRRG